MFYFVNEIRAWTKSRREIICWEGYSVKDKIILCSFSLSSYYNTIPFNTFGVVLCFKRLKSQHSIKPDGTCLHVMTYRFVTKVSKFSHLFTFSIYTRYLFKRLNMHSVSFHSMFRRNTVRLKKNRDSAMCIPKLILTDLTQKVGWLLHFVVIINYQLTLHLYNQLRRYDIALATLQSVDDLRPKLFRSQYSGACSDVLILFLLPFKRPPRKLPKEYQPLW